jgi:hypothetical protein
LPTTLHLNPAGNRHLAWCLPGTPADVSANHQEIAPVSASPNYTDTDIKAKLNDPRIGEQDRPRPTAPSTYRLASRFSAYVLQAFSMDTELFALARELASLNSRVLMTGLSETSRK